MDAIVQAARSLGYTCAHFTAAHASKGGWRTPVKYDGKGFPDLVLARPRRFAGGRTRMDPARLVFIEVKGKGDRLRPDQERWLDVLRHSMTLGDNEDVLVQTFVWTPNEWRDGTIERVLR